MAKKKPEENEDAHSEAVDMLALNLDIMTLSKAGRQLKSYTAQVSLGALLSCLSEMAAAEIPIEHRSPYEVHVRRAFEHLAEGCEKAPPWVLARGKKVLEQALDSLSGPKLH